MEINMPIPEITPEQAKQCLDGTDGYVYLDVRTPAEFVAGHPAGALNIPVAMINPATGGMELNPRFLEAACARLAKETKLIVGCKSGQRSAAATQMLLQAGYQNVVSMCGGFGGVIDPTGHVLHEGWSTLGYPVERGHADRGPSVP